MAVVTILNEDRQLSEPEPIRDYLASIGIEYEQWTIDEPPPANAPAKTILDAYKEKVDELKTRGGYVTADVIDVTPQTPDLEQMLAKFNREHWHDEDEVRFIISGNGLFHINDETEGVVAIQVAAGDLIRVPRGTLHWFNLCGDLQIRAIRLFQDVSGWTPHYSDSEVDQNYQPLCFGLSHFSLEKAGQ